MCFMFQELNCVPEGHNGIAIISLSPWESFRERLCVGSRDTRKPMTGS